MHTKTITKISEPEHEDEAPKFTCVPMTTTDTAGDALELGDDCGLTFNPASEASTRSSSVGTTPSLQPRATIDENTCLYTQTVVVTCTKYTIITTSTTVIEESPSEIFSCPPMSVTNSIGDELSLDEECKLEFSRADSTATPTAAAAATTTGSEPPNASSNGTNPRVSQDLFPCCNIRDHRSWFSDIISVLVLVTNARART